MIADDDTAATRVVCVTTLETEQLVDMLTLIGRRSPTVSRATVARVAVVPRLRYQRCASARIGDRTTFSASRDAASAVQSRLGPAATRPVGRMIPARAASAGRANVRSPRP